MSSLTIDKMREKRNSKNVPYIKFARNYSPSKLNILYCFFEGDEDKRYYIPRIEKVTSKESKVFTCKGKDKVIELFEFINTKAEYMEVPILYFVDKDYSNDRTINNLYVTPCYSIENFYSDKYTVKKVLINEFNLDEDDNDFLLTLKLYQDLQDIFHLKLLVFNAWLSCQNDIREKNRISTRLKIDGAIKTYFKSFDKVVKSCLKSIDSEVSNLEDIQYIEQLYPSSEKVDISKLEEKIYLFRELNHTCIFRGKFEIRFLVSFLKRVQEEMNKKESNIFEKKSNCSFVFDINNAISNLSNYAYTPECLEKFLIKFK